MDLPDGDERGPGARSVIARSNGPSWVGGALSSRLSPGRPGAVEYPSNIRNPEGGDDASSPGTRQRGPGREGPWSSGRSCSARGPAQPWPTPCICPSRTWRNYEAGVAIPAVVVLQFIEVCGVNPDWLRSGRGRKYTSRDRAGSTTTAVGAGSLGSGATPGVVVTTGLPADDRIGSAPPPPKGSRGPGGGRWLSTYEDLLGRAGGDGGLGLDPASARSPSGPRGISLEAWFRERHRSVEYSLILGRGSYRLLSRIPGRGHMPGPGSRGRRDASSGRSRRWNRSYPAGDAWPRRG